MSPEPRPDDLLSKLADALPAAIKDLHPIFRFVIAIVILIVILVILGATVPQDLMELLRILIIGGFVAYMAIESLLFVERTRKGKTTQAKPGESKPETPKPDEQDTPPPSPQLDATAAQKAYLRRLQTVCNALLLQYIDPKSFESEQVRRQRMQLADVYTTLDTTTQVKVEEKERTKRQEDEDDVLQRLRREQQETRPLTALQAAADKRRMVLLGDPGSGKSTFVKYLALCLAGELLEPGQGWLARLGDDWPHGPLWPLLVTLRDFARSAHCDGSASGLWAYIAGEAGAYAPRLRRQLDEGGVLLLFDGLDEVADPEQRARVRDAVAAFARTHNEPRNRCLVTCRVYAYMQRDERGRYLYQLPEEFVTYTLAEFTDARMDAFIQAWYQEVYQLGWKSEMEAKELADRLQEAVRRPGLRVLATRPLLLTVMALLHTTRGRLPDDRVKLYQETVELLLARWQEARLGQENGLSCLVNIDQLETALCRVTYGAHLAQQEGAPGTGEGPKLADIPESALRQAFAEGCLDGDWNRAGDLIEYVRERAGLLVERAPGVYTYPHRTFQEYLAASHLATLPAFPQEAARLLRRNPTQWREAVLMAVGIMARINKLAYIGLYVVQELCPGGAPGAETTEAGWRGALHAGEALLEIGIEQARAVDAALVDRVRDRLAALLTGGRLAPADRLLAGRLLDDLGWLPDDLEAWVLCPGCADGGGDLLVGKYPVTNAQYARFVDDPDGYANPDWWSKEGWQWRWSPLSYTGDLPVTEPYYWHSVHLGQERKGNPVVGVCWYEADAYCNWLTAQLRNARISLQVILNDCPDRGVLPCSLSVRLPTIDERDVFSGGTQNGRHPWDPLDGSVTTNPQKTLAHSNRIESEQNVPSPVVMYPLGTSLPYGLMALESNVQEWNTNRDVQKHNWRSTSHGSAVTTVRAARYQDDSLVFFGFRCVSSISPSGS